MFSRSDNCSAVGQARTLALCNPCALILLQFSRTALSRAFGARPSCPCRVLWGWPSHLCLDFAPSLVWSARRPAHCSISILCCGETCELFPDVCFIPVSSAVLGLLHVENTSLALVPKSSFHSIPRRIVSEELCFTAALNSNATSLQYRSVHYLCNFTVALRLSVCECAIVLAVAFITCSKLFVIGEVGYCILR